MKTYPEIIKDDKFKLEDNYKVNTEIDKMCWGCEKKFKEGIMVWDASKMRRFFFCQDCFEKLKD